MFSAFSIQALQQPRLVRLATLAFIFKAALSFCGLLRHICPRLLQCRVSLSDAGSGFGADLHDGVRGLSLIHIYIKKLLRRA